jgi:hypothetical protein
MGIFDTIKEKMDEQEIKRAKHQAALEKIKLHEHAHNELMLEKKEAKIEKIRESAEASLTAEEKEYLARRQKKIDEAKAKRAAFYAKIGHAASSAGNTIRNAASSAGKSIGSTVYNIATSKNVKNAAKSVYGNNEYSRRSRRHKRKRR